MHIVLHFIPTKENKTTLEDYSLYKQFMLYERFELSILYYVQVFSFFDNLINIRFDIWLHTVPYL